MCDQWEINLRVYFFFFSKGGRKILRGSNLNLNFQGLGIEKADISVKGHLNINYLQFVLYQERFFLNV